MPVRKHPLCTSETDRRLPHVGVDKDLVDRLDASFRRFDEQGVALAETFYRRLFTAHASLRRLFPDDMTAQRVKLTDALRAIVNTIRHPATVRAQVQELGRRHLQYGTKPEHYPLVRDALVGAMGEVAGDWWTSDLQRDWHEAITQVCEVMLEGAGQRMPDSL
jgi:hemoglobin-like flavoprotein